MMDIYIMVLASSVLMVSAYIILTCNKAPKPQKLYKTLSVVIVLVLLGLSFYLYYNLKETSLSLTQQLESIMEKKNTPAIETPAPQEELPEQKSL